MTKATLADLLSEEEKKKINDAGIKIYAPLADLTVSHISTLFSCIKLRSVKNGLLPGGFIVSLVWDELATRTMEKRLEIYDPFKNAATGEEGLRVAKEQTERINKEWEEKTSKFNLDDMKSRNVDVIKVITDLVKELRQVYTITQGPDIVDELPAIQNAEAALGMLDALNPKRRYIGWPSSIKEWTVQEVREALAKQPIEWKKAEMTQKRRDEIVKETARLLLRADKKPSFLKANAIMFAIESVLNAKGL